ncbi:glycine betaine/L-proline ABC transporter ATP-binding protein [Acidimicrobiia bacterium EGI L10123]|uniref:quaternary amine ABC transporter ATP-binding protein n=1 Tax=Salinilacustrithrix flava TaxID=2957203 RepID=UPI003D7C1AC6|nr:glycine betaine/L-proline ABC transporter ATP-binding protein [Acidimicrobiia bacterium EGI L10123]
MSTIQLRNIYKVFGRRSAEAVELLRDGVSREEAQERTGAVPAVIDISLDIEPGELFVVMGLSGSGKSTLVRTINRLHEPTAGTIELKGRDITRLGPAELREVRSSSVSMVFQHFALFPHRTVLENAAWGLEVRRRGRSEREERSREALRLVGLEGWEDSYPDQLSGGMQQRVGLARALATDADVLLMDEAFSALDPLIRREMQDQLVELQDTLHKTIVFITHDLNEAMRLGDRIAVLKDGRLVQVGTAEDILQDPANDYVASFVQDVDRSRVLTAGSVMEKPQAVITTHDGPRAAMRAMRSLQVSGLLVVDAHRKLRGYVTDDDVATAMRHDAKSLESAIRTDVATISPDVPLVELFVPAAETPLPLPVEDEHGRLVGVVPRVTLLAALGGQAVDTPDALQEEDHRG